jgi:hypothetical protein
MAGRSSTEPPTRFLRKRTELILSLRLPDVQGRRLDAIEEIKQIGLSEGGWVVYGAWEVLYANFLNPVPAEVCEELIEPRVRFLQSLGHPRLKMFLNSLDMIAYQRLFPEEFAQMFPDFGRW